MNQQLSPLVLVSGGSKGLGLATVSHLLESGFRVATFSRSKTDSIVALERDYSEELFCWREIDSTNYELVEKYVKDIYRDYGSIYGLINNVGIAEDGVLMNMDVKKINYLITVNLESSIRLTLLVSKHMLAKKEGVIVNISSIIGVRGYSGLSVYSATKGAIDAFSRSLAREMGARNVRVNSLAPGYLETEMSQTLSIEQRTQIIRRTPLGRLGKVEDVVGVIRFMLSKEAQFITGQTLVVDGGITC